MTVNRSELARRVAARGGYKIGDIEDVLSLYEDEIVAALEQGEEVKVGKLMKIIQKDVPEKKAWDGLNTRSFIRPAKIVPKVRLLSRLKDIERPVKSEEEE